MAINERIIHTASAAAGGQEASGNQEEGLMIHYDANDVDSYDGDGSIWYDITDYEYSPATDVSEHFNTVLYTGTGTNQSITGFGFNPDLIWTKRRDTAVHHHIFDTVRGNNAIYSTNDDQDDFSSAIDITSSNNDGFDVIGSSGALNTNNGTYVAWGFKAGGTAVANTSGDINSNVSVNNDLGFSIVKYTATGTTATVGHGLDAPPELILAKPTNQNYNWIAYAAPLGAGKYLIPNSNSGATTASNFMNDTEPTASVFTAGTNNLNYQNGNEIIAYCFTSKRGVSKVGSYTGNGGTTKVYTGFKPAFVMVKRTDSSGDWVIYDNKRGGTKLLFPHLNNLEGTYTSTYNLEFNTDGFSIESGYAVSGGTYVYLAIAERTPTELTTYGSIDENDVSSLSHTGQNTASQPTLSGDYNIFGDLSYQFNFGDSGNTEGNNTITITLNTATAFKEFAVYETYQSNYRYTGTVKVYGSNDNTNFTLLCTTVQNTSIQYNRNSAQITDTTAYLYYKFDFYANTRGTYQNAWKIELLKDEELSPVFDLDLTTSTPSNATVTAATYDEELGNFYSFTRSQNSNKIEPTADVALTDRTIEMWINPTYPSSGGFYLLDATPDRGYGSDSYGNWAIYMNSQTIAFVSSKYNGSTYAGYHGNHNAANGKWAHVAMTCSGNTTTGYVNGIEVTEISNSSYNKNQAVLGTNLNTINLGRVRDGGNNTTYGFDGKMGQVRIYDTALTQEQILQNYKAAAHDYPNGINATAMNSPTWNSGGYWQFDGGTSNTDAFSLPNSLTLQPWFQREHTVSMWVNFDSFSSYPTFWATYDYSGGASWGTLLRADNDGRLRQSVYYNNMSTSQVSSSALYTGQWYHVVASFSQGDNKLYINNSLVGTNTGNFHYPSAGGRPAVGALRHTSATTTDNGHHGKISKFKLYDRFLTTDEIQTLYDEGE